MTTLYKTKYLPPTDTLGARYSVKDMFLANSTVVPFNPAWNNPAVGAVAGFAGVTEDEVKYLATEGDYAFYLVG